MHQEVESLHSLVMFLAKWQILQVIPWKVHFELREDILLQPTWPFRENGFCWFLLLYILQEKQTMHSVAFH